MHWQWKC